MSKGINSQYQGHNLARYTYHRPTYHLPAAKKHTKNKGNTKKPITRRRKKVLKICLDSRQETGQKQKQGEDRMSNMTRQDKKGAERKMESNDSPETPDRGGTSEEPILPSGHKPTTLEDGATCTIANLPPWRMVQPVP